MAYNRAILEELTPAGLYEDNRPAIWPDLPEEPIEYVIVGEAPGKNEVKHGRIFVGKAGQLLRDALYEVGITRYHLTNSSLYRPATGAVDVPPTAGIIKAERPRVHMEISMLQPKAVIAVGGTAWESVVGNQSRLPGMVKRLYIHGREIPVFLTWHPAAVFRNPDYYQHIVETLHRAAQMEVPRYFSRPIELAYPKLGGTISVDVEATSPHSGTATLLCVAVSDAENVLVFWADNPEDMSRLQTLLDAHKGEVLGHNALGDEVLLRRHGINVRFTQDTILQHLSQNEIKGTHKLKALAPAIAKVDTGVDWIWAYTHAAGDADDENIAFKDIPKDVLQDYCAVDALATYALHQRLTEQEDKRTKQLYEFLMRAHNAFGEGMYHGIHVDQELLGKLTAEQEEKVAALRAPFSFNPGSHPQTLEAFQAAGFKIASVDKSIVSRLGGDLPQAYTTYKREHKMLSAFLRPLQIWISEDGQVRPTYKIHGTDSGRTSCGDPNLQQVPPALRALFTAREGHLLVGWDFKVHEVRGIAYLSRDQDLCKVLQDVNADPHQFIADKVGLERSEAKRALFAVAYGAGVGRLIKTGMDSHKAEEAFEKIKALFPSLEAWRQSVCKQVYEDGYVETPYGRRRHFYYMDDRTLAHQERVAVNFKSQSLCGDIAMESAIAVYEELGYPPLIFVHDFNAIEVPESKVEKVVQACAEIAGAILPNSWVRFVPEVKVGRNWGALQPFDLGTYLGDEDDENN